MDRVGVIGLSVPVFAAAKEAFDKAMADGWGDLDIACVHDQVSGVSAPEAGSPRNVAPEELP
jgi:hypothetical protein